MAVLKLGTRQSLLAWAQSSWVAREIEKLNPGIRVDLVGIETRGDRVLDVPLRQVEGKEFFVAEIDQALLHSEVDFTVHSMKDLSLERPSELHCAAIPRRENPRDVILFGPGVLERARAGKILKIGTSSPRRLENIPPFLEEAFPRVSGRRVPFQFVEIRGNVNTRLTRIQEPDESERYLDGVVLAFAGLIRLWKDENGQESLKALLKGVRWMILPLAQCPAAPAQGALAVECRSEDAKVRRILEKLHDPKTAEQVRAERRLLADWGGGCHQRFGATCVASEKLGSLLYIRGRKPDGDFVKELAWHLPLPPLPFGPIRAWDGTEWRSKIKHTHLLGGGFELPTKGKALFIAHSRAADPIQPDDLNRNRIWTSGVSSWFRLAERGIWVEGCAEELGFDHLIPILEEAVLELPCLEEWGNWIVLTHSDASGEWGERGIYSVATYKMNQHKIYDQSSKEALKAATHVFWSSGSQCDELKGYVAPEAKQACGPGRTASKLMAAGAPVDVFPSVEEWRKWLNLK